LAAVLADYSNDLNALLPAINTVINDPSQSVSLTSSNGAVFALDASTLALSDQLIAAYVLQFVNQVVNSSGQQSSAHVSTGAENLSSQPADATNCPANDGIDAPVIQVGVCDVQQYSQNLATAGAQAVQLGAKIEGGTYLSFLGGWAVAGFTQAGAISATAAKGLQLAWTFAVPYITAFATSSNPPPLYNPLGGVIAKIVDSGPILAATLKAYQAFAAASAVSASNGGSGAIILTSSQASAPKGSTVVNAFQYSNGTASVTALAAPANQQVTNVSNITVPPPPTPSFTLTVIIAGSGGGTVTSIPTGLSYPAGTSVTLVARPNAQSTFASWGSSFGDCLGISDTCSFTVNADEIITANFNATQQFALTTATSLTGSGVICVSSAASSLSCGTNGLSFAAGSVVTLTVTPNSASTFAGWSGACSGTGTCTLTMNSNQAVTATFNLVSTGPGINLTGTWKGIISYPGCANTTLTLNLTQQPPDQDYNIYVTGTFVEVVTCPSSRLGTGTFAGNIDWGEEGAGNTLIIQLPDSYPDIITSPVLGVLQCTFTNTEMSGTYPSVFTLTRQ
jgi:hypothetical protein